MGEAEKTVEQAVMDRRAFLKASSAAVLASAVGMDAVDARAQQPRGPVSNHILIKNGVVLTFDQRLGDFDRADILIEGKRIVDVRPGITAEATVIDAANMIVLPGFIDSHHHLYQALFRNVQGNGLLVDYFRDIANGPKALTQYYRPHDAYLGGLSGALRSLDAGVTTIADISQVNHSPEHSDELIRGFKESHARIVFAYAAGAGPAVKWPQDMERLQKQYFSSSDQLLTPALGTRVDREQFAAARRLGVRIWTHVVRGTPGVAPEDLMKLGDDGLMRSDNVYIHMTGASPELMKRVASTGGAVSCAVPIEMTMRHGMPPVQLALDNGVRPSLSSDVETSMTADMFTMMRSCFLLQRVMVNERVLDGEKDVPKLLTAREVIAIATVQGAKDCALDSKVGSLTPGKEADIVMLRADTINTFPLNNAYGAIVTGMDTSNVDTVLVAGKIVKRHGRLVGYDMKRLRQEATAARDYIVGRMGWPRSVIDTTVQGR
jgi:cytosine/adenosine deaminase-related metal-dependent hydrolase